VSAAAPPAATEPPPHSFLERIFDRIERLGNRMPHPVILFILLCGAVIVVSQILYWVGWKATYEVVAPPPAAAQQTYYGGSVEPTYVGPTVPEPAGSYKVKTQTARVKGLLTGYGVRYLFTSFVSNFRNFAAVAIILVVMLGVGLAESVGLIAALIRKLVGASSPSTLTFIIVLLGVLSSIASDAGYLVLIPLGAAAFKSVGRNPLAGIAAAFAGVAAGFGVNFLITPLDGVLTEITNDAAGAASKHIDLAANLFFGIGSTIFITIVMTIITAKLVENRLGAWDPAEMGDGIQTADEDVPVISAEAESRGLRYALWATLAVLLSITLLTAIPGAPLRNPVTGSVIGDSPFMDSLIVIITLVFFAAGTAFGKGAGTLKNKEAAIESITKSWAGLASLLLLFSVHRAVHRLLQLQQHRGGCGRQARRRARAHQHRRGLAADRGDRHHCDRQHHHPAGDREVGAARADLHPALHPAQCRAADRPRRLPRRRLAGERAHATDGVLPADRDLHAAVQEGRRHRHRDRAHAAVRGGPLHRLDAVLRGLVPDRDPARPRIPGPHLAPRPATAAP
jgi:aminobenzoyl-glutamate transport protein